MSGLPLVSVIVTNYNYSRYIGQAIESVIDQTYANIEIIVIDDGSTDDSDSIIKEYVKKHSGIIYKKQKNHGVVYARNKGMELANGEYLCCLDADDFFNTDYIQKNYQYATKYNADVVYPNWQLLGDIEATMDFPEFDFIEYQKQHFHIKPESLIRSSAIKYDDGRLRYGYIPETKARANDWAYFVSLAASGLKFKLAKDNYINYRIKQNSMGNRNTHSEDIRIFYKYLTMFKERYGEKIIEPIDLPIDIIEKQDADIVELRQATVVHNETVENLNQQIERLEIQINSVYGSRSWRITRPLRLGVVCIKKVARFFADTKSH